MINKLLPRILNSSKDSRVRAKNEMKDAINIRVTDNYDGGFGAGAITDGDGGDSGVLKPAPGNIAMNLSAGFDLDSVLDESGAYDRRIIGKIEDSKSGVIYFFLFSSEINEMGVYAWDSENTFGGGIESWRPIYCTPEFNFTDTSRVVGDIVHVSGGADDDFRPILYFTDDENEPRKIDVQRCLDFGYSPALLNNYTPNDIHDKDFITACPRSPVAPPYFEFFQEAGTRASDFRKVPGVQFAYQCVYRSGEESALSTYSDIAIPIPYLRQGVIQGETDLPQLCRISIDPAPFDALTISEEVVSFKILVRRGNDGPFYIVDEVDKAGPFGTVTTYDFYNDKVLLGITESEENKQYDNLPRRAQAIAVKENRLFYGNYVEGYDEAPFDGAVAANYIPAPASSITFDLQVTPIAMTPNVGAFAFTPEFGQRVTGVSIDTSSIPEVLPVGVTISVSFSFQPDGNLSLYNSEGGYHNSKILGGSENFYQQAFNNVFDTTSPINYISSFDTTTLPLGSNFALGLGEGLAAMGSGPGVAPPLEWIQTEGVGGETSTTLARIGTSAAAPLMLKGGVSNFSVELETLEVIDNAPIVVSAAIGAAMSGQAVSDQFSVNQSNIDPSYNFNHGLRSVDPVEDGGIGDGFNLIRLGVGGTSFNDELAINVPTESQKDALDCITAVFPEFDISGDGMDPTPIGYCIVNEANVEMSLVHHPLMTENESGQCVLSLEVSSLSNVDVLTCIPILTVPDYKVRQWRIFSGEYLEVYQILDINFNGQLNNTGTGFSFTSSAGAFTSGLFHDLVALDSFYYNGFDQRKKVVGYLRPAGTSAQSVEGGDILITNNDIRSTAVIPPAIPQGQQVAYINSLGNSMIDSEGGFKYERPTITIERADGLSPSGQPSPFAEHMWNESGTESEGSVSSLMILTGLVMFRFDGPEANPVLFLPFQAGAPSDSAASNIYSLSLFGASINLYAEAPITTTSFRVLGDDSVYVSPTDLVSPLFSSDSQFKGNASFKNYYEDQLQEIEVVYNVFGDQLEVVGDYRSFKTSAYHDLGVVYYDDRGRPGNVNVLPRVYVGGYSNEERNQDKGRVELEITLNSTPPEWAHQYQIVYAGNSTYQDFIQYTVAGAFIDERGDENSGRNIYLSLNHLQQDSQVSYAESFGAVNTNGTKDLYTFAPGDQVRVISYEEGPDNTLYPNQLVFDVVDQLILTGNNDTTTEETRNPLDSGSADTPLYLQGSFIQLRDNPEATGFNWGSVRLQGNDLDGSQTNWAKRCVVEIVRPRASADSDIRGYQETGLVFNVGRSNTGGAQGTPEGIYHQTPTIFMRNGDVWWRRIPLNLQPYDNGEFVSLIPDSIEEEDGSSLQVDYQPRFRNRYLESKTFTDTFAGADVNGYGKVKFYVPESAEVRRESSITYSDANDFSTVRIRYTSFNPYQAPFKDLPNEHGAINAFVDLSQFLMVVQEDKLSAVPINRNILSDASGGDQLISSDKIIGTQKFISGKYGADNNRESVILVDDTVYFASKSKGEVYRYSGGKVDVISRKGMQGFLYEAFQDNLNIENIRVVSGYDPLCDEYILSVINIDRIPFTPPNLFTQPYLNPFAFNGSISNEGGTGVTPGDTDWETSYEDPMEELIEEVVNGGGTAPDGVAPEGTSPPNSYTTDVAEFNKDEVISVLNGNPPQGFDPLTDPKGLQDQVDDMINPPYSLNLNQYLPPKTRSALGDFTYYYGPIPSGSYSADSNTITNILSKPYAQAIVNALSTTTLNITPGGYGSYIDEFGNLIDTPQMNLIGALQVRSYELTDLVTSIVVSIKNDYEQGVITLADSIADLLSEIESDISEAGLQQNITVSTLLSEANISYQELNQYITNTLGRDPQLATFLSDDLDDETVLGFGNIKVSEYPISNLEIFGISSINTLMDNIGDSVNQLLSLDGIDVTDLLEANSRLVAGLRSQVDVLTNQVQNLSAAPVATTGETFIPNVTTNQITSEALEYFAGADQEVTIEDVVTTPELSAQIDQIIELYSNSSSIVPDAEYLKPIIAEVIRTLAGEAGYGSGVTDIYSDYINASDDQVLNNLGNQLNPTDLSGGGGNFVKDGAVGVEDVLNVLSQDELFGTPTLKTGAVGSLEALYDMWESSDPFTQYQEDVANGIAGAGGETVSNNDLLYSILWYQNKKNGTSLTANAYSELGFTHEDIYIPPDIASTLLVNIVPDADQVTQITGAFDAIITVDETDPENAAHKLLFGSSKINGGYLSTFGIPLFPNYGVQTTNSLTNQEVLDIITTAIDNAE